MAKDYTAPLIPEGKYGPKFEKLGSDRQRAFVLCYLQQGDRNAAAAYRSAGYQCADEYAKQEAYRLLQDPKIQEAIQEQASRSLYALAPMALKVLGDIIENPQEKGGDRLKGALGVLDRAGLHAKTETVTTLQTDTETLELIRQLAKANNIPLENLLGSRLAKTVDVEFEDITPPKPITLADLL